MNAPEPTTPMQTIPPTTKETAMNDSSHSGRHPVNTGHLVMGVAFAGLVAIWGLISAGAVADENIRWLLPLTWVLAGALGLVVATMVSFRKRPVADEAPSQPAYVPHPAEDTDPTEENR